MFRLQRSANVALCAAEAAASTGAPAGRPRCIPSFLRPETYRPGCVFVPPRNEAALPSRPLGVGGAESTKSQDAPQVVGPFSCDGGTKGLRIQGKNPARARLLASSI